MLSSSFTVLICTILAITHYTYSAEIVNLPRTVKTCKKDTPDYTSCLRLAIQESWPVFMRGIPELDLPTLDPYTIDTIEHGYESPIIKGKFVLRDVRIYGLGKTNILAVRPEHSENHFTLEMDIEIPKSLIEADYQAKGSVGAYKLGGNGHFNMSLEGVSATWRLEGSVENDIWRVEHFKINQEVSNMQFFVDDLFDGNPELTKGIVKFINANWAIFYRATLPVVIDELDRGLTDRVNEMIFSKLSYSTVFP